MIEEELKWTHRLLTTLSSQPHSGFTAQSLAHSPWFTKPPVPGEDGQGNSYKASRRPEKQSFSTKYSLIPSRQQTSILILTQGIQGTWEHDSAMESQGSGSEAFCFFSSAKAELHPDRPIQKEKKSNKNIKCPFHQWLLPPFPYNSGNELRISCKHLPIIWGLFIIWASIHYRVIMNSCSLTVCRWGHLHISLQIGNRASSALHVIMMQLQYFSPFLYFDQQRLITLDWIISGD